MKGERGATLLEVAISSLIVVIIVLAVGSAADQTQKRVFAENDRIEMQRTSRAMIEMISTYTRAAGADRAEIFDNSAYTTSSVIPIPQASSTMVHLRSDYDDDGVLSASFPEDLTVSWNDTSNQLSVASVTFAGVSDFLLRYYDSSGNQLTPPVGGWNIATSAAHGGILRSIARIQFEVELESRHRDPETNELFRETLIWDVTLRNQLTTV